MLWIPLVPSLATMVSKLLSLLAKNFDITMGTSSYFFSLFFLMSWMVLWMIPGLRVLITFIMYFLLGSFDLPNWGKYFNTMSLLAILWRLFQILCTENSL